MNNTTAQTARQQETDRDALSVIRFAASAYDRREVDARASMLLDRMEIDAHYPNTVDALTITRHGASALRARRLELDQDNADARLGDVRRTFDQRR